MAEETNISWADATFNPWIGCAKVSPACDGCYAEALMGTTGRYGRAEWGGPGAGVGTRVRTSKANWSKPRTWDRKAAANGTRPFVFCASLADVFDNAVPTEWRRDLFDLIRATPNLTWLLLTKRPGMIVKLFDGAHEDHADACQLQWPRNAAIGFTAVTQAEMDRDSRRALGAYHALSPAFLFWSGEPLLEHVIVPDDLLALGGRFWAITGGETDQGKHKARDTPNGAFQGVRDQCVAAGVPYQHKQNKGGATRDLDGRFHDARPKPQTNAEPARGEA